MTFKALRRWAGTAVLATAAATPAQAFVIGKQVQLREIGSVCAIRQHGPDGLPLEARCSGTVVDLSAVSRVPATFRRFLLTAAHCGPMGGPVEVVCDDGRETRSAVGWVANDRYPETAADRLTSALTHVTREADWGDSLFDEGLYLLDAPLPMRITPIPLAATSADIQALTSDSAKCVLAGHSVKDIYRKNQQGRVPPGTRPRTTYWQKLDPADMPQIPRPLHSIFAFSGPDRFVTSGDSGGPLVCPDRAGNAQLVAVNVVADLAVEHAGLLWDDSGWSASTLTTNFVEWIRHALERPIPPLPKARIVPAPF